MVRSVFGNTEADTRESERAGSGEPDPGLLYQTTYSCQLLRGEWCNIFLSVEIVDGDWEVMVQLRSTILSNRTDQRKDAEATFIACH